MKVSEWLRAYSSKEDEDFLVIDYNSVTTLAKILQRIDRKHEKEVVKLVLFWRYTAFDTSRDFLQQYTRNIGLLEKSLQALYER